MSEPAANGHIQRPPYAKDEQNGLCFLAISELRPTQMTIGYSVVRRKREKWRGEADKTESLKRRPVPVVLGPGRQWWIIDRHHLVRALHEEGISSVPADVVEDLSGLRISAFASAMEAQSWLHPFDGSGRRSSLAGMPVHVRDLTDDPFRSLASEMRRRGGYLKDPTPHSEFKWADFLRTRFDAAELAVQFDSVMSEALKLARGPAAEHLPGWRGQEVYPYGPKRAFARAGNQTVRRTRSFSRDTELPAAAAAR